MTMYTASEQRDLVLARLRDLDWELRQLNAKLDSVTKILNKVTIRQMENNS